MSSSYPTAETPTILKFMSQASEELGITLSSPKDIFAFGEGKGRVTKELNDLALAGKKTTTTSFPVPNPQHWGVGDLSIGLDENNQPCFLMRTTELRVVDFDDVDAAFAADEGEGDLSLDFYKSEHRHWYKEKIDHDGQKFGDGTGRKVLCERFEIIWPLGVKNQGHKA